MSSFVSASVDVAPSSSSNSVIAPTSFPSSDTVPLSRGRNLIWTVAFSPGSSATSRSATDSPFILTVRFRVVGRSPGFSTVARAPSRGPPEPDPPARHSRRPRRVRVRARRRPRASRTRVSPCGSPSTSWPTFSVVHAPSAYRSTATFSGPSPPGIVSSSMSNWSVAALVPSASSVESNSMCPNATPWGRDRDRSARPSAARSSFRTPLGHRPDPPRPRSPTRRDPSSTGQRGSLRYRSARRLRRRSRR